jgi:hypothetical protein
MRFALEACNIRAGTDAREPGLHYSGRRQSDSNVFRRLKRRLLETGRVIPTVFENAGHSRSVRTPAREDVIIAAVEQQA